LEASLTVGDDILGNSSSLTITLVRKDEVEHKKQLQHRYQYPSIYSLQAPSTYPTASLQALIFNLSFKKNVATTSKRQKHGTSSISRYDAGDEMLFTADEGCVVSTVHSQPLPPKSHTGFELPAFPASQPPSGTSNEILLDDLGPEPIGNDWTDLVSAHCAEEEDITMASSFVTKPLCLTPNENKKRVFDSSTPQLDETTLISLTDAMLRTAICDRRTVTAPGVKLKFNSSSPKLAEIAPALFSPGYATAVSKRTCYISRITSAIRAIGRQTDNVALKESIESLRNDDGIPTPDPAEVEQDGEQQQSRSLHDSIERHLWKIAQLHLFDPLAARRLKSFATSNGESNGKMKGESLPTGTTEIQPFDDLLLGEEHNLEGSEDADIFESLLSGSGGFDECEKDIPDGEYERQDYSYNDDESELFCWLDDEDAGFDFLEEGIAHEDTADMQTDDMLLEFQASSSDDILDDGN
jgi:hypothetical protein